MVSVSNELKQINPPNADVGYLMEYGRLSYWLFESISAGSICRLSIELTTPSDPHDRCAVRMDIDFMNAYMAGQFDDPQEMECHCSIKDLKLLRAFPKVLDALTNKPGNAVRICDVLQELELAGVEKGPSVNDTLEKIRQTFNTVAKPVPFR